MSTKKIPLRSEVLKENTWATEDIFQTGAAWEKAFEIHQEYISHPVRKEAWFPVSIPIVVSNPKGENEYITYTILVMKDFSTEGKTEFFEEYREAWNLMDSNLPIKE